jgi:hypothetical protein
LARKFKIGREIEKRQKKGFTSSSSSMVTLSSIPSSSSEISSSVRSAPPRWFCSPGTRPSAVDRSLPRKYHKCFSFLLAYDGKHETGFYLIEITIVYFVHIFRET